MRILMATDLSARCDRAMARSFRLAAQHRAELVLLHVVDRDLPEALRTHSLEWAKGMLDREVDTLSRETGVTPTIEIVCGEAEETIVRRADAGRFDVLVLGIHADRRKGDKPFSETTAGRVLRSSLTAALVVRDDATAPYANVIVGVDFSAFSKAALRQAARLAPQAHLHVVRAFHVPFKSRLGTPAFIDEIAYAQRLEIDAFLAAEMEELKKWAGDYGIMPGSLTSIIEEGAPAEVLRRLQKRIPGDLIVIGTHGRGMISRAIWGSVATDLLNDPPCDVLVIKPF